MEEQIMDQGFTKIPVKTLAHSFDDAGNVTHVSMNFQSFGVKEGTFNSNIEIFPEDLPDGKSFDDITPKELQAVGRQKLSKWILVS